MEGYIAAVIPSILSGIVLIAINRANRRNDNRDAARSRESFLILKNISAIRSLTELTAKCVKNGEVNGNMDKAMEYSQKMKHEMDDYLMEVNAQMKRR